MLTEWKSMAILSELTTAFPKEVTIQLLVDILERDENSTNHHHVSDDEQNTEIDLVGRAQEVAIDADRDHVAIATGNHPTQNFKSGYSFIVILFSHLLIIILDPHRRIDHLADPEARSIPSRDP